MCWLQLLTILQCLHELCGASAVYTARIFQAFASWPRMCDIWSWSAEACLTVLAVETHTAPLIWICGPNSTLLAVRAHAIIYYNSPNCRTPVLWKSSETPSVSLSSAGSHFQWQQRKEFFIPFSSSISFSKLWKIRVFCWVSRRTVLMCGVSGSITL